MATKKKSTKSSSGDPCCVAEPYVPPADRKSGWKDYEVRDALRTLTDADKIKRNKPLMALIRAEAKKQLAAAAQTVKAV